jgi:hypothetical protein
VLTKPGVATFAAQMGKASWRMVWVQLLGWRVISTILGFVAQAIFTSISYRLAGSLSPEAIQALSATSASHGGIIGVPLGFFIWMSGQNHWREHFFKDERSTHRKVRFLVRQCTWTMRRCVVGYDGACSVV